MKKATIALTLFLVIISSSFASKNILYSYDYNRYYTNKNDFVISGAYLFKACNFDFRKLTNYRVSNGRIISAGFEIEALQRRAQYSFYEDFDYLARNVRIGESKYKICATTLRFGALKDFFFDTSLVPLSLSIGGGICSKIDWFDPTKDSNSNYSISLGLSAKIQGAVHLSSEEGRYNLFLSYQPDIFLLNNTENQKLSITKNLMIDQSITTGVQIRIL